MTTKDKKKILLPRPPRHAKRRCPSACLARCSARSHAASQRLSTSFSLLEAQEAGEMRAACPQYARMIGEGARAKQPSSPARLQSRGRRASCRYRALPGLRITNRVAHPPALRPSLRVASPPAPAALVAFFFCQPFVTLSPARLPREVAPGPSALPRSRTFSPDARHQ